MKTELDKKFLILKYTQLEIGSVAVNKGRFCNNSEIETLISKRLYVENKAKLSQLIRADFVTIAK